MHLASTLLIKENFFGETQKSHHEIGSQCDKNRVDEEQVKSPKEEVPLPCGNTISGGTERRHKSRSNSHTREHLPFAFGTCRNHPCRTTKEGDKHIVDIGLGTP